MNLRSVSVPYFVVAAFTLALAGCGDNKFQKEVETEKSAVGLARQVQAGGYDLITTEELKKLIDDKSAFVLVDTMPAEDFGREHIPGAINFDLPKEDMNEWDAKKTSDKTEEDFAKALGEDKNKPIVVYCGFTACGRSHNGAMWAQKLGYTNVKRQPGGIFAWKGAGNAVEKSK
ncbi:MAG: rhodanese-like domain-containing protein [Pirellulales bacterium]